MDETREVPGAYKTGNGLDMQAVAFSLWPEGSRRVCHIAFHPPQDFSHPRFLLPPGQPVFPYYVVAGF